MKDFSSKSRQNILTIFTVIGLLIIISVYFFIYIPKQENNVHRENFRVLTKISANIDDRVHEYKRYINDRARYSILLSKFSLFSGNEFRKYNPLTHEFSGENKKFDPFNNDYIDAMSKHYIKKLPEVELIYFCPDSCIPSKEILSQKLESKPYDYFLLQRDTCSYDGVKYEYGFTLNMESIKSLIDGDAFTDYFLVRNDKIIFGPEAGLLPDIADSMLSSVSGIKTGKIFSQTVSGADTKLFAQPFQLGSSDNFILCGMINNDVYHHKTRNLSGNIILFILLGLFLILLSLPFIKFLLMSRNERLNISDALFAGITVILGTAVLFLVLLDVYTYCMPARESRNKQLKDLSSAISGNFRNEINSAYRQLQIYDSLIGTPGGERIQANIISLGDSAIYKNSESSEDQDKKKYVIGFNLKPKVYSNFKQVFWTDSTGEQLFKWTTGSGTTPLIQVDERDYFRRVMHNQVWSLPVKGSPGYVIEGLYSWTTGENVAVIAKKSHRRVVYKNDLFGDSVSSTKTSVAAISTVLYSVMDPILPLSSGFCIIDDKGKVIFHSDKKKNLTENFLDECSDKDEIQSSIYSRSPSFFSTDYQNGKYNMYITPIDKLPFYMVTFQDSEYSATSNAETLSLSMILVLGFFAFVCIQVTLLRIIKSKQTLLRSKIFSFNWVWPILEKQGAYQQIVFFLIPLFFLQLVFLHFAGPIETILVFFISSVMIFGFVYLKIDQFTEKGGRKKILQLMSSRINLMVTLTIIVLTIILNFVAFNNIDCFDRFFCFEFLVFAMAVFLLVVKIPIYKLPGFRRSYLLFQLGMLTLVSIVPTFAFFRIAFEKSAEIRIRHGQLELAEELNAKSDELNKSFRITAKDDLHSDIYSRPFYDTRILPSLPKSMRDNALELSPEEDLFSSISVNLTPSYNNIVTKEQYLANPAEDLSWIWKKNGPHSVILDYHDLQRSNNRRVDSLVISSQIPSYKLPSPFGEQGFGLRGTLFWIGVMGCILLLYCFIRFVLRTIFTIDFFKNNEYRKLDISVLKDYFDSTNIFLIGAPYSGKTKWLNENYAAGNKRYTINLVKLKTMEDVAAHVLKCKDADTIFIDHFEYGAKDFSFSRKKLRLFEQLMELEGKRILIISTIHPRMFIDEYPLLPEKENDKKGKTIPASASKAIDDRDRWIKILGGYHKLYFRISGVEENEEAKNDVDGDIIDCECQRSFFLKEKKDFIRQSCKSEKPGHELSDEEIILRIQSLAHVYYNSLWASLSEEEQYIVYDLAQDGLMNLKNREVITMLLNKGIIVYDNMFKLMNESFRNFVLTEVSAADALALERKVKETGTWNYFKTPVILILITLALFIFITQQETFNTIIAFVTTFAAGIPIVFRLLGMLTSMKAAKVPSSPE
jgi:hypothetical protein